MFLSGKAAYSSELLSRHNSIDTILNDTIVIAKLNTLYDQQNQWCPASRISLENFGDCLGVLAFTIGLIISELWLISQLDQDIGWSAILGCGIDSLFMMVPPVISIYFIVMGIVNGHYYSKRCDQGMNGKGLHLLDYSFNQTSAQVYVTALISKMCNDLADAIDREAELIDVRNGEVVWNKFLSSVVVFLLGQWVYTNRRLISNSENKIEPIFLPVAPLLLANVYNAVYGYRRVSYTDCKEETLDKRYSKADSIALGDVWEFSEFSYPIVFIPALSLLWLGLFLTKSNMNSDIKNSWQVVVAFTIGVYQLVRMVYDARVLGPVGDEVYNRGRILSEIIINPVPNNSADCLLATLCNPAEPCDPFEDIP